MKGEFYVSISVGFLSEIRLGDCYGNSDFLPVFRLEILKVSFGYIFVLSVSNLVGTLLVVGLVRVRSS